MRKTYFKFKTQMHLIPPDKGVRGFKSAGFTIIEMMIAISLFLIVVTMGMGALLNANRLHKKSQDMRSIMDNLSFIMEDMSRNLRTGDKYSCITGINTRATTPSDCINGNGVSFKSSYRAEQWVYFIGTFSSTEPVRIYKSTNGGQVGTFIALTTDEVRLEDGTGFTVIGARAGDMQQPFVTIRLVGTITTQRVATPFALQTSVSQRLIDR